MSGGLTLPEKLWRSHVISGAGDGSDLLYVDLHLVHEATSSQAFDGIRDTSRTVRRPDLTLAVEDHNVPTDSLTIRDPVSNMQVGMLRRNCTDHGIRLFQHGRPQQGIVHVVGPEIGAVQPGMTVLCGDSHTSTHGAFGALAFGIGTSDVEHVLATQTLEISPFRTMLVEFVGEPPVGVTAKDLALAMIAQVGTSGGQGHVIEYRGPAVSALSMEGRMTLCNMSVEAGARAGMIAPDEVTLAYLEGREHTPTGQAWSDAVEYWRTLRSDDDAVFDRVVTVDTDGLAPFVTWGTNPSESVPLTGVVPDPESLPDETRAAALRSLEYMGLKPGTAMRELDIDVVFLGSCTNGRIEDLRAAAEVLRGRQLAPGVEMLVVPGSMAVRQQAEEEGLAEVFRAAGALWRLAGCSMCLGMNADRLRGPKRCASTSNRNYQGRQGPDARTHLVSPAVAAATAVRGRLTAPHELE
ncbi:3-isopropylmalate dehydratase large subunit [Saccharomonospora piscinae]|uniref:3-isopropylmalate dehydratase large subunit n=1 Tax=Saccharomonospora piscinae TaxID=687388 RepID=A0A1V8ZYF2_SACPI|nr:3-isopropylmalate dehydratase large subunit [Saccharomonospora piscinae]OQO89830.1 3-isopropylmalate dehydratase large subunit [Saccharomonospora piscinae]TLW90602.1 3-isopropylmalate dehydratase large subunit [Saccharomonospora piscinae]